LKRWAQYLTGSLIFAGLGCSQPLERPGVPEKAVDHDRSMITGDPFRHLVYRQGTWDKSSPVHVYLEGDGLPWVTRTRIARDPTPRTPLALHLMSRDPGPALYIGRPCYHGLAESPDCSPWLWTNGRYSEEVVKSMAAALRRALGPDSEREVTLIGYSGGGVLAMLIAARTEQVAAVVTIAANLDIAAWADHHGYSRLLGSLNPATQPPLPARIRQIHLAGERDIRVPAHLSEPAVARQPNARLVVVPNFGHVCCWERAWPAILAELQQHDVAQDPQALQLRPPIAENRP
jgi:predicted alpha/beta hydrolase family esterase